MSGLAYSNPNVQRLRRLIGRRSARHGEGRFVVEGPVLVAEAVDAGWRFESQFVPEGATGIDGAGELHELAAGVLERVAATETPRPPLAIAEIGGSPSPTGARLDTASFVLVLDRIADPGNLGTILRSAEAAGVEVVVLTPGSVDPYGPKAVRASAGALFHVPVVTADLDAVAAAGLRLAGTSSHTTGRQVRNHRDVDWSGRIAIVMGNEAAGLPDDLGGAHGSIDDWVTIEHVGRSESLNVAMAATILVFEAAACRS